METLPSTQCVGSVTSPEPHLTSDVPRVTLKAPDKAKILRRAEVKILPLAKRKQTGKTPSLSYAPLLHMGVGRQQQQHARI